VALTKEVTVAGAEKNDVALELLPLREKIAHVAVRSHLPDADVVIDGKTMGKTPLAQSLSIAPGHHVVELRRAGYDAARKELELGDGAVAELSLEPQESAEALRSAGGELALDVSEPRSAVTIDGKARGVYEGPMLLPPGPHDVIVEHGGFVSATKHVVIDAHQTAAVRVYLAPTAETRAAYDHSRSWHHTAGIVTFVAGVVVTGAAIGFIVWNANQVSQDNNIFLAAYAMEKSPPAGTIWATAGMSGISMACINDVQNKYNTYSSAADLRPVGYIGLGVGIAAMGAGAALYFTGGSSHRFDAPAVSSEPRSRWHFLPWANQRSGGIGVGTDWD
jgi:PEGA domain